MRKLIRWAMVVALGLFSVHTPLVLAQINSKLLEMSEQLDKLERQDLSAALEQANACTQARDFECSDRALAKAEKSVNGAKDQRALQTARNRLANERQLLAQEIRRAEEARVAELERQRIEEERERRAQLEAEKQERRAQFEAEEMEERRAARRANEEARNEALAIALGRVGRPQPPQDWLMAETQKSLARTPQLIADARREQANEAAARQAEANRINAERAEARREANEAAERRARMSADQAASQRQAEQTRLAEQARRDEQARREREARDEQRRLSEQRIADAEAQRAARAKEAAEREAAKRAEAETELRAKRDYLGKLITGTRLAARKCPGGEGKYYVVGLFPKVSPQPVSCKDVYFKATCPGDVVGVDGVGKNFLGAATDCYMGDTVKIEPLACTVEQVSVRVTDVRACGE